jgi:alpha-beta hydrolase superfamily lysophospholipase
MTMRSQANATPAPGAGVVRCAFPSADGTALHALLFRAAQPRAGLLMVHGLQSHAGWFEASGTPAELAAAGITSVAYDRRGSGYSGGARGHADSADDFLIDLQAATAALRRALDDSGAVHAPIHVLANCFATRTVLPYAAAHPNAYASLILTAPATHMSRRASYGLWQRLAIVVAAREAPFATPLHDHDFVRSGPWLEWIHRDELGLRRVTAAFLRSVNRLTRRMQAAIPRLRMPLLVVLSRRDVLVDNEAIRRRFVTPYAGPKQLVEYDTDHYVDFSDARPAFARLIQHWVLETSAGLRKERT